MGDVFRLQRAATPHLLAGPSCFSDYFLSKRQEPEQALIGSDLIGILGTGSFLWANWNFSLLGSSAVHAACQWLSWEGLGKQIFKFKWFLSNLPAHLQLSLDFWGTFLIQSYCEPGLTLLTAPCKLIGMWRKWGAQGTIPLQHRQPHFGGISRSGEWNQAASWVLLPSSLDELSDLDQQRNPLLSYLYHLKLHLCPWLCW